MQRGKIIRQKRGGKTKEIVSEIIQTLKIKGSQNNYN